jgi:hypothetical protein
MAKKSLAATSAADFGCGLLAFVLVRLMPVISGKHQDIRPFVLTTFLVFLSVAMYRVQKVYTWRTVLFVALGGIA